MRPTANQARATIAHNRNHLAGLVTGAFRAGELSDAERLSAAKVTQEAIDQMESYLVELAGCNGWTNRPTWNANLWLANERALYDAVNELSDANPDVGAFADEIEGLALRLWRNGETPDGQPLAPVNWVEIATSWREP